MLSEHALPPGGTGRRGVLCLYAHKGKERSALTSLLLFVSVVLLACSLLKKVSGRLGIPSLLMFILLGMLFGSDGLLKIPFEDYAFAEQISSIALVFIMFYGGFGTNWKAARPVAALSVVLSSLGTVLTALLTGLFCCFVLGMPILEGLLCGAVLGSTDAASVFSILRSRTSLALKENTASAAGGGERHQRPLCLYADGGDPLRHGDRRHRGRGHPAAGRAAPAGAGLRLRHRLWGALAHAPLLARRLGHGDAVHGGGCPAGLRCAHHAWAATAF